MSLLRSSLLISLLSFVGSLLSFASQLVIARCYGASIRMDAYLIASSIPMFVSGNVIAVFSYSLVPTLIVQRTTGTIGTFVRSFLLILSIMAIGVFIGGYVAARPLVEFLGARLSQAAIAETMTIARVSWGASAFSILFGFFGCLYNSRKSFYTPVIAGMMPYVGIITSVLVIGTAAGPITIAWGLAAGTLVATVFLALPVGKELKGRFTLLHGDVLQFTRDMPLVFMAMTCFTIYQSMDSYWAPRIGPGNLAYLGYCQRLLIAIGNLVIAGPSVVLVPRLTEAYIAGRYDDFLRDLALALRLLLACAVPIAVMVSVLRVSFIELLFQRGAFDHVATQGVAGLLPYMIGGMVPMLSVVILFRALFAKHEKRKTAFLGVMAVALYFGLSGLLSAFWGVSGIGVAYALSWTVILVTGLVTLFRGNSLDARVAKWWKFAIKVGAASGLAGAATLSVRSVLVESLTQIGWLSLAVRVSITGSIGCLVYIVLGSVIMQISEVTMLRDLVMRKLFSSKPV